LIQSNARQLAAKQALALNSLKKNKSLKVGNFQ
jgi:hypothetical protein